MSLELQDNRKLVWIIAAIIILLVAGLFATQWYVKQKKAEEKATAVAAQPITAPTPASAPVAKVQATEMPEAPITLVDDNIVSAPIPSNPSLAKEELAKLDDIQKQLQDQQKNLESQHADADQLIKLKEEQVNLLEQQLGAQK